MPTPTTDQPVLSPLQNLLVNPTVNQTYTPTYSTRIGQTFNLGALTGELKSIEIKFAESNSGQGIFTMNLFELKGTNLILITNSIDIPGPSAKLNIFDFAAGNNLRANTQYAFFLNSIAPPYGVMGSNNNAYKSGTAFYTNREISRYNYNPINNFDLYFTIALVQKSAR